MLDDLLCFFFNYPAPTEIYTYGHTLSLHDSLPSLEVHASADGEVSTGIQGFDPVLANQVTRAEIARCEGNPKERLRMATSDLPKPVQKTKGPKYIPIAKRGDKPDGIAWLVKHHPDRKSTRLNSSH